MKKHLHLLLLFLVIFLCVCNSQAQITKKVTTGTVVNQKNKPLSNVMISFDKNHYVSSDPLGRFAIQISLDSASWDHQVHIIKKGWKLQNWKFEQNELKIVLKPAPYFLRGRIINEFNMPVSGVNIGIRDEIHPATRAVTDSRGGFMMQLPQHIKVDKNTRFVADGIHINMNDVVFFKKNSFVSIKLRSVQTADVSHIMVYNEDMRPMKGIKVLVDGKKYTTDEHGEFALAQNKELIVTDHSEFLVEKYPIIKLDYVDVDQYMYIHIRAGDKNRRNKNNSHFLDYTKKFNFIFNQLELEKQLLNEKSNKIRQEIEEVNNRLSKAGLKQEREINLKKYLTRLEGELVKNEVSYENAHEKTNDVLGRLKLLILEKDSLHSVTSESLKLEQDEHQETRKLFNQKLLFFSFVAIIMLVTLIVFYRMSRRMSRQKNQLIRQKSSLEEHVKEIDRKNHEMHEANEEIRIKNDALKQQKGEIEQKNAQITASLMYARRIQRAMLPHSRDIKKIFPESFVLFKPKDIVSGDFYWLYEHIGQNSNRPTQETERKIIIAAVDCTGHGVPGGFMSMVGDSLLDQIVKLQGIHTPEKILNQLNSGIISTLRQNENKNRDGMDLAICTIKRNAKVIEFAGAKNTLVYIQNDELRELKGDRASIGGLRSQDHQFTKQTIKIDKPTTCYLFSDGYQDQFGGSENRKFMKKKLLDLLLKIHKEPCDVQKNILEKTFNAWKGSQRQIDDIMLIGLKIC